jgi:hypothetical protein
LGYRICMCWHKRYYETVHHTLFINWLRFDQQQQVTKPADDYALTGSPPFTILSSS